MPEEMILKLVGEAVYLCLIQEMEINLQEDLGVLE